MLLYDHSKVPCLALSTRLASSQPKLRGIAVALFSFWLAGCQSAALSSHGATLESDVQVVERSIASRTYDAYVASGSPIEPLQSIGEAASWQQLIYPLYSQARQLVEAELKVDLRHIQLMLVDDQPYQQ